MCIKYNAVEIMFLLVMLSYYRSVDKCVNNLYNLEVKNQISVYYREIFEKLSVLLGNEIE